MKKFDTGFEDDVPKEDDSNENLPTAVYTVYNVHGEPIGHRLYSYQPVYEPEIGISHEDVAEYEDSSESDDMQHVTVLKGGMFHDKSDTEDNINKLKHDYFEKYLDKRSKRYLNKNIDDIKKELDTDLQGEETTFVETTKSTDNAAKVRRKRNVNVEELARENWTFKPTVDDSDINNDINVDLLKVIPLEKSINTTEHDLSKEMAVIPLQYNKTNSTEVDNILDKRDKRTSRKTDRLNQTTATIPKT